MILAQNWQLQQFGTTKHITVKIWHRLVTGRRIRRHNTTPPPPPPPPFLAPTKLELSFARFSRSASWTQSGNQPASSSQLDPLILRSTSLCRWHTDTYCDTDSVSLELDWTSVDGWGHPCVFAGLNELAVYCKLQVCKRGKRSYLQYTDSVNLLFVF